VHVVHVYKDVFPPVVGGIERHIDGLRRAMPDVRTDVLVCARARRTSRGLVATGLEVRVAEAGPRLLSVPVAPTFPLWLRRSSADLVHVHMPNPVGEAAALMGARGRPLVVSYHADVVRQRRLMPLYGPLVQACLGRATAVLVGSDRLLETSPQLARHGARVRVVRYGVDMERLRPDAVTEEERDGVLRRFGAPPVLAVARLVYYKGLEDLVRVAAQLGAPVAIAGSGPLEPRLRALARGVPNVHLLGRLGEDDLRRHLAAASCFVMASTSRAESFGVATVEAQAMGVPAVVTDVGTGTVEAIEPGETGLVVRPGAPGELAAAIRSILDDPARAAAMGRAARARAVARHSLTRQAAHVREVYAEALRARDIHAGAPR
jgi:glycosyltransferase involved in cell wall biosynthesis